MLDIGKQVGQFWADNTFLSRNPAYRETVKDEISCANIQRIRLFSLPLLALIVFHATRNVLKLPPGTPRIPFWIFQIVVLAFCLLVYTKAGHWQRLFDIPLFGGNNFRSAAKKIASSDERKRIRWWIKAYWLAMIVFLQIIILSTRQIYGAYEFSSPIFILVAMIPLASPSEIGLYLAFILGGEVVNIISGAAPLWATVVNSVQYTVFFLIYSLLMYMSFQSHMVVRVELEKANRTIRRNSMKDSLTGLYNRRAFHVLVTKKVIQSQSPPKKIAAIMIDIDYFKSYNDVFGHLAGDICIKKIARQLLDSFPPASSIIARLGGEEFIVLLADEKLGDIRQYVKTLQQRIAALNIPAGDTQVAPYVTVSVGILRPSPTCDFRWNRGYALADMALYRAKDAGRNRVFELDYGTSATMTRTPRTEQELKNNTKA